MGQALSNAREPRRKAVGGNVVGNLVTQERSES